ncbi:MAG: methyltransferase domain-containing protein, partial [Planctomycetota bacterium]
MSRRPFRDVSGAVGRSVTRPGDWEAMYEKGEGRWDLGGPSPPLVAALGRDEIGAAGRALVPGCGFGHDVRLLAARGWDATGIDFARPAVREAKRLAKATGTRGASFERRDLFRLPRTWAGSFDLVFEQTLFCAIHPDRRDDYVEAVGSVLRPGGQVFGLFFNIRPEEGPPF